MGQSRRKDRKKQRSGMSIPDKANRILHIILFAMLLIVVRIWHLSVIQYDAKSEEAQKPRQRLIIEPAKRGTIRDRFNIPLALNKVKYQAAIYYTQLKEVPRFGWREENGKKVKFFKRREYITQLAQLLGRELQLDPERLEDLIYSKAAFYYNVPFIVKDDLSEEEYYHLKMYEKDWPGIYVSVTPRRHYPQGMVGAEVIGYMGAISRSEFENILHQIGALENYLTQYENGEQPLLPPGINSHDEVNSRLKVLQAQAYTASDYIGKNGIESVFERKLRGLYGKKRFYSDAKGNFLRELPGSKPPQSGQRILLTISSELQEYAEQLLAANEKIRDEKLLAGNQTHSRHTWIKGGAIVAVDPNNGEVLALASYPRFDPNDFILSGSQTEEDKQKNSNIQHWFEGEAYIGEVWDQKRPLEREIYDNQKHSYVIEKLPLTWNVYLDFILPKHHPIQKTMDNVKRVEQAFELQNLVVDLMQMSGLDNPRQLINLLYNGEGHTEWKSTLTQSQKNDLLTTLKLNPAFSSMKQRLNTYFALLPHNYDKVLLIDLCRLAVPMDLFTNQLLKKVGKQTIASYRDCSGAMASLNAIMKKMTRELFHEYDFKPWRQDNEKAFLKAKRAQEKADNSYPKPYLDYLDQEEEAMFAEFWKKHRWNLSYMFLVGPTGEDEDIKPYQDYFLAWNKELRQGAHPTIDWRKSYETVQMEIENLSPEDAIAYMKTLRSYNDLDKILYGKYRHLRTSAGQQTEKSLAAAFYPLYGYGHARSQAFRQSTTQGSIFKLTVAYAGLMQRYEKLMEAGKSLRELNPLEIVDKEYRSGNNWYVGYTIDGQPIHRMYKGGRVPKSLTRDIGKIDLVKALETSSNPYFALIAGDHLDAPEDLANVAKSMGYGSKTGIELTGEIAGKLPTDLSGNRTGLYSFAIGQHAFIATPLQSAFMVSTLANGGTLYRPKIISLMAGTPISDPELTSDDVPIQSYLTIPESQIRWTIPLPHPVRNTILKGMQRVVARIHEEGFRSLSKLYSTNPEALKALLEIKDWMVGKSSSAETVENLNLDVENGLQKSTHIWFGGILFDQRVDAYPPDVTVIRDFYGRPELVVIVYLRFAGLGKDGAPIAAQIAQKWRQIKQKYQ